MEHELTQVKNLAYPVTRNTMEESIESGEGLAQKSVEKDEEKMKREVARRLTERQQRARRVMEEEVRRRTGRAELTQEEIAEINKRILRGEMPIIGGGSGDGKYENFNAERYKGSVLEDVAQKLKSAGENSQITPELIEEIQQELHTRIGKGVSEKFVADFLRDMASVEQGQPTPEDAIQQEQGTPSIEKILDDRIAESLQKKEGRSSNPRNIQEVALSIINDEGRDRWGPDGTFPLLSVAYDEKGKPIQKQNSQGEYKPVLKLNEGHFIKWFRERMMYHHISNSRDESLQLGNLVGITSEFGSTISIFSMDKDRGQYFLDMVTGKPLDTLANQLKNELWLFGNMRNYDLLYQKYMGSDSDLPKFLAQLHEKEEITQPHSLETIMTLPGEFGKPGGDTAVGDAIRKSYEIYFYASDMDKLKEVLGKDSVFFKKEGFVEAFKIIEKKDKNATVNDLSEDAKKFINNIFNGDVPDPQKFIKEMNPFNEKNKPEFNKNIMREMVRQVVAKKYELDTGINAEGGNWDDSLKERDLVRKDLEYAEAFAWVMTRWTGAAARNDTSAIGFDAFTKVMKFRDYRKRQSSDTRAGAFGNEYDTPIFKGLASDFFNGITVEKKAEDSGKNITPFEIFRKISAIEDNNSLSEDEKRRQKEYWAKRLNFEQYIQRSYSSDHINRAFEIFHSTMGAEEMRLEEIVKWDPFRGIILDRGKFEEQVKEKFIKPTRYAFSTYSQLDMGKIVTVQTGGFGSKDAPVFKEMTMAESLFGPEVLSDVRPMATKYYEKEIKEGKMTSQEAWQNYLSGDGRSILWKRAVMARMAAHIKSHRQFGNGYTPFTAGMVNTLYDALESIKSIDLVEGEESTEMYYDKRFLTKEDIDWIRRHSGTTETRLFMTDFMFKGVGGGVAKGMWEGAGLMFKDIFK